MRWQEDVSCVRVMAGSFRGWCVRVTADARHYQERLGERDEYLGTRLVRRVP